MKMINELICGVMVIIDTTGTSIVGGASPTPEEAAGWANRIEVYKCNEVRQQNSFF